VFGAPDYYGDDYIGTGVWDLMAGGSWGDGGRRPTHINMFLKITYGWVTPVTLNNYADIRNMPNAEQNAVAYMIEAHTSGEHYVLENRQQVGFDATLPGHGLLIYHVHKNALGGKGSNMNKAIQELYPVCATASVAIPGANPESYGNINSSGCPFPGAGNRPELSNSTTPMLFSWETRAGINKALHHIVENGGMISFDFVPEEKELKVNGKTIEITDNNILRYTAACGERNVKVEFISSGATVTLTLNGNTYPNGTTLPLTSDKTVIEIAVRTISEQSTYLLNVIQSLGETTPLYIQRWGSTLALINNPANNGGYIFDDFRWYHIDDSYTIIGTNPFIVCNDNCNAYYIRAHNSATGEWHDICPHVANNAENNVVAYPNPISAGQSLFFTLPESASRATVRIYDMAGNLIYQQRGAENHITAPAQTGLFLLQITLPDGTIQTQKIIITK
jgi:hypothetical protein